MVKGLIYNGRHPETILEWLGSAGEESCEFGSSAMFSPYLSAEDCECNSKGRYWSTQLDTDATNLRKSLCVPVTGSPSHIHLTIHLHSVSSLTLSLRYLKTAPRHLFADDTLALLSSHFCPMLRALDSHIASSTYSTVITLQVSCYYTRLCIPTNVCWGKGQMNMTSRPESKREMAQEPYALSKTNSASSTTDEPVEEAK